ncbi:cytochrome c oxidase assembly protein [Rhodobacteraceae bacterium NNCM2]|nr:cytochrome c oxidase assembly protein [Coraliihabitans acroporae]
MTGTRKTAMMLAGVAVFMVGMAFAAVPLYDLFCRVTGFGGTTQSADSAPEQVLDRTVVVRFDASTDRDMPWAFKPAQLEQTIRIGEVGLAFYEAHNPTDRPITGTATFNVTPFSVGGYFTKIDCFCFTEQTLQPGERVMMPVSYYVDPEVVEDDEAALVHTITLSYTFYETEPEQAGLDQGDMTNGG